MRCSAFSCPPRALRARSRCCRISPPSSPLWRARRRGAASNALAYRQLPHCRYRKKMGLHRSRQSVVSSNRRPCVETALPLTAVCPDRGTAASSEHRGSQVIKLTTDSGSVWMQASLRAAKTRPVPLTRLPLVTRLLMLLGSRHTTRPAHAGVSGHRTTVRPLFFIAYPQTRVPAPSLPGPYAGAAGVGPNPLSIALIPAS